MCSKGGRAILRWSDYGINKIKQLSAELMKRSKATYDSVGSLAPNNVTYENTLKAIAEEERDFSTTEAPLTFLQHVSENAELRDVSCAIDKELSEFGVEMSMRQDVFQSMLELQKKNPSLEPEEQRLLDRLLRDGRRNGLHLSSELQEKVKELKKKLTQLEIEFGKNLSEEKSSFEFSEAELSGLSEDFIKSLSRTDDNKCVVTLKYPHCIPVAQKCTNPHTRATLECAFNSRCKVENGSILKQLTKLRNERAALLGYKTHADFITEVRMAKSASAVEKFLSDLADKLKPLVDKEWQELLRFKSEECQQCSLIDDGRINAYDFAYYCNMVKEKNYAIDQDKYRPYFPLPTVTKGLLEIYQELLGLKFSEVKDAEAWNVDVQLFDVHDVSTSTFLGQFYLDLYPRDGKYGHAACFGLQPGCTLTDGTRQPAIAAMVANFTKPLVDKPSLLNHREVETYFHEFGHVMHQICSSVKISRFSGTHVERDFVEAPSQMLENWCWEAEPLKRMSGHYKDATPLPDEMIKTLVASRNANAGLLNMRQIVLATLDQRIHCSPEADPETVYYELMLSLLRIHVTPDTCMPATFGHLGGGYDAQYYGYMWSEVFSDDMFEARFLKEGVMSPKTGADYRHCILNVGGTKDASEMLREFLGRDPTSEAFLRKKGLKM
ncbi:thimet oligopeptidase-like [Dysidea avara]|uniref:thimet oligopeptidase-like n=1 Tax=Dysidea avara TaxID=196820 RepID=UPI003330094F